VAFIDRFVLGRELAKGVPSKADYIFRKEPFGAVAFNKENLKQIYIDNRCLALLESIDSNKTIAELLDVVSTKTRLPKMLLAAQLPVYLKTLRDNGFVQIEAELPNYKIKSVKRAPLVSAPNQISWLITNQCNLHCSHCGNTQKAKLGNELSTDECKQFLDQCAENKVFVLNISGGEPFVNYLPLKGQASEGPNQLQFSIVVCA